jgi:hypothetical protein
MTDKKMIRKLTQALHDRDAAGQERGAQRQAQQTEFDNLREQHEGATGAITKLTARAATTSTDLGGAPKTILSMDRIVTLVQREVKNTSNADADADSEDSGTE